MDRREGVVATTDQGPEIVQAGEVRLARLESLRAIAALGVALGHAWGLGHGYVNTQESYLGRVVFGGGFGVYLFFALSGYLLFWPFARRSFGGGAPIDLGRYAVNRAVRILPLYVVAVVVLLVLQENGGTANQWWHFLLLAENFSLDTVNTVDGALWSLVVEVHFYVLLPLIAAATAFVARERRWAAAAFLVGIGAVSLAVRLHYVQGAVDPGDALWRYNLPSTFFFFIPGMLLALLRLELEERRPAWLAGPLGRSGPWLLASGAVWLLVDYDYALTPLTAVASFLAVAACVLPLRDGAARRALDWRPLAAIGVVSYSLYVWHSRVQVHVAGIDGFPKGTLPIVLITMPLAVGVAFVSYRLIEEPFLRLRRRWSSASARQGEPAVRSAPAEAG